VEEAVHQLNDLENFVKASTDLKVVLLDEIDALATDRRDPRVVTLTSWTMHFLEPANVPSGTIVLGTTNNPNNVDAAVLDRFSSFVFFDLPDQEVVRQILTHEKVSDPEKVAAGFFSEIDKRGGGKISGRSLKDAVEVARAVQGSNFAKGQTFDRVMFPFLKIQPVAIGEQFRHSHQVKCAQSELFLNQYGVLSTHD